MTRLFHRLVGFVALLIVVGLPGSWDVGASARDVNGNRGPVEKRPFSPADRVDRIGDMNSGAIGCQIQDGFGDPVTTVSVSRQRGDAAYWLLYRSDGGFDTEVRFTVTPMFAGSPLAEQVQVFTPHDETSIVTPFGIPFWGVDATSGPWVLVVENDRGGAATCAFDVVP